MASTSVTPMEMTPLVMTSTWEAALVAVFSTPSSTRRRYSFRLEKSTPSRSNRANTSSARAWRLAI